MPKIFGVIVQNLVAKFGRVVAPTTRPGCVHCWSDVCTPPFQLLNLLLTLWLVYITFVQQPITLLTTRFNIKKFWMPITSHLRVRHGSQNKLTLVLHITNKLVFIPQVGNVYSAVALYTYTVQHRYVTTLSVKVTEMPVQDWTGPYGSRRFRLPEFLDNRHLCMVRLSALCTGRPICVRDWVHLDATMQPEGLSQWIIPMTPSGIEPAISRL
jgi:hypothetical protein